VFRWRATTGRKTKSVSTNLFVPLFARERLRKELWPTSLKLTREVRSRREQELN
jgi:hypothetical protein